VVAAGARGRTQSELLKALGAGSREELAENVAKTMARALPDGTPQRGGPRVAHACAIWHERARTVKPAFRDAAASSFKAVTRAVDFLRNVSNTLTHRTRSINLISIKFLQLISSS
jgi:serpin B